MVEQYGNNNEQVMIIKSTCPPGQETVSPKADRHPRLWLKNYKVKETLGQGNFGKVKLAINSKGQKVALKFIDHEKLKKSQYWTKFQREIEIHKTISHPNIVKLYEVIEAPDYGYTVLVLEYLDGVDLLDHVLAQPEQKMNQVAAVKIFAQLLSAVQYLHALGIAHRDLKLENVMVDIRGETPKLIDFGLANTFTHEQMLRTPCGSPFYAAPEILNRQCYSGPSNDVWGLGVVLYSMITGTIPWAGDKSHEQLMNTLSGTWLDLPSIPVDLKRIFNRIFVVDFYQRATIQELIMDPLVCSTKEGVRMRGKSLLRRISGVFTFPEKVIQK